MFARSKFLLSTMLAASVFAFASTASAKTYHITFAGAHSTQLPWMKAIQDFYIPEVNRRLAAAGGKDKIVWTEAFAGTLAKVGGVLDAVQDDIADMGMVYTIFEPSKLPLLQVTFMAPFGSSDVTLISRIMLEMNAEMPELKKEWASQNQVYLADIAADTDQTWTKFPVHTLADYKGRKLGASGSLSLWANGIGAVAVQGNFATHYNNIKTGVYDGLIAFTTGIYPIKVYQVAPYMTKVNLGSMSIGAITINKQVFDSMSPQTQKILRDVGVEYSRRVSETMKKLAGIDEKKMAAYGTHITVFPQAERKKWAMTMPNIAENWVKFNEKRGIPAKKVLDAYMAKLRANHVVLVRDWDKF